MCYMPVLKIAAPIYRASAPVYIPPDTPPPVRQSLVVPPLTFPIITNSSGLWMTSQVSGDFLVEWVMFVCFVCLFFQLLPK